jgi:hypothetical protein
MGRKRPAELRLEAEVHKALGLNQTQISGISAQGNRAIAALEVRRKWPGYTALAYKQFASFVRDPYHRLWVDDDGCGIEECCPSPYGLLEWLEAVTRALPPKDRKIFASRFGELYADW